MQDRNRIEGDETEAQLRRTETPEHLRGATADVTQVNEAERRLAADLDAMTRLQRLGTLSVREGELAPVLEEIVEAAIAIAEADFGNIQLLDPSSGELRIAAQRGFPPWWVAFWDRVPAGRGACGTALAQGGRVIVEDIETSPLFRETPALEIQRRAGVRAVQSTTLRSRSGETIGVFSTHYRRPYRPDARALKLLDLLAGQAADIIDRERIEATLRESERKFATVFHASPVAKSLATFPEGRIQDINEAWLELTGFSSRGEVLGRTAAELGLVSDTRARQQIIDDLAARGAVRNAEVTIRTRTGEQRTLLVDLRRIEINGRPLILDANRDVTDARRAEVALQRSAQRNALLSDTAARLLQSANPQQLIESLCRDVMAFIDCQAFFNYLVDDQEGRLQLNACAGIPAEEARRIAWLDYGVAICGCVARDGRRIVAEDIQQTEDERTTLVKAYGIHAYCCNPLTAQGRVIGTLSFGTRTRAHFTTAEVGLMGAVASLVAIALQRIEADRRKDAFLATLAHELRNPLAPIRNAVEILNLTSPPDPDIRNVHAMIDRQVSHLVRLIDDLMDVSRITRGKLQLRRERVDLATVLEQAVEVARPLLQQAGQDLSLSLPSAPVHLYADPVRLAQVFSNLLNNASKYTPTGGRIALLAEQAGSEVLVRIVDSGSGIAPEHLPHVFEMFRQVPVGPGQVQSGLGIGLSLVRALVEMHGGRVEARSEGLEKGSAFLVWLPAESVPSVPRLQRHPRPDARATTAARILIVDDNEEIVESLARVLRLYGHEVDTARDGLEAVAAAERCRPQLVLLDLGMPRLDGYGACRRIRAQPWGRQLKIIAMTGWGRDTDRGKTATVGFDAHWVKPVAPSAILDLLSSPRAAHG